MAKVALITEQVTPLVETLAKALQFQKQDVVIVTSREAARKLSGEFSVLAPFRKWNAFEAVRSLPALLSQNFDVWHFLFPSVDSQPLAAHWILGACARGLQQKVIAGSFSDPQNLRGWRQGKFPAMLDLALFPNRSFLMQAKREKSLGPHTLAEVLPPLEVPGEQESPKIREEVGRLLKGLGPYLVLPDLQNGPAWLENSPLDIVVLKPHPRKGSKHPHVFYTGELHPAERDLIIENARAICLLFGEYSTLELQRFHQWSERFRRPLIVNRYQTEVWPGLCWHERSGWVLEDGDDPLRDLLIRNPQLNLPGGFENFSHRELVDSTLNELLRLYQRSFTIRWANG